MKIDLPFSHRTWKDLTFLIGLGWLLYGATQYDIMDWDIKVSLLMAFSTYLSADRLIQAIKQKSYPKVALLSVAAWWSIDGVYWLYWSLVDSSSMIREAQWPASLCLYLLCGIIWASYPKPASRKPEHLLPPLLVLALSPPHRDEV